MTTLSDVPALVVTVPSDIAPERRYALGELLDSFLDVDYAQRTGPPHSDVELRVLDAAGGVVLPGRGPIDEYLTHSATVTISLKPIPAVLPVGASPYSDVPVVGPRSESGVLLERHGDRLTVGFDILAATYWFLAREEEVGSPHADAHGRFPAEASLLVSEGVLGRPVVDEYADLIRRGLMLVFPSHRDATGRRSAFRVWSTHDMDNPALFAEAPLGWMLRRGGALLRSGRYRHALSSTRQGLEARLLRGQDPAADIDPIMDRVEEAGASCAFNFMSEDAAVGRLPHARLGPSHPIVADMLRRVLARGHSVGVHLSYESHLSAGRMRAELHELQAMVGASGFEQSEWGNRFHYLRFDSERTPGLLMGLGLDFDSTLGFAERPGFRCGAARPYRMYDRERRCTSRLQQRPLMLMDSTLFGHHYLGLRPDSGEAYAHVAALRDTVRAFGGELTILWHNETLIDPLNLPLFDFALTGR